LLVYSTSTSCPLKKSSKSSFVINQGLKIQIFHFQFSSSTLITVDSIPKSEAPPSIINSIFPSTLSSTIAAEVGLGFHEIFALGAAIGLSTAFRNSCATLLEGILIPTKGLGVTISGITSFFFKSKVRGQGKSLSIICC
jgi:hypothetical protein